MSASSDSAAALKAAAERDTALKLASFQAERDRAMAQTAQAVRSPTPRRASRSSCRRPRSPTSRPSAREAARDDRQEAGRRRGLPPTARNGAQGIGEIMNQVIGRAGPALDLARQALGGSGNGRQRTSEKPAAPVA